MSKLDRETRNFTTAQILSKPRPELKIQSNAQIEKLLEASKAISSEKMLEVIRSHIVALAAENAPSLGHYNLLSKRTILLLDVLDQKDQTLTGALFEALEDFMRGTIQFSRLLEVGLATSQDPFRLHFFSQKKYETLFEIYDLANKSRLDKTIYVYSVVDTPIHFFNDLFFKHVHFIGIIKNSVIIHGSKFSPVAFANHDFAHADFAGTRSPYGDDLKKIKRKFRKLQKAEGEFSQIVLNAIVFFDLLHEESILLGGADGLINSGHWVYGRELMAAAGLIRTGEDSKDSVMVQNLEATIKKIRHLFYSTHLGTKE